MVPRPGVVAEAVARIGGAQLVEDGCEGSAGDGRVEDVGLDLAQARLCIGEAVVIGERDPAAHADVHAVAHRCDDGHGAIAERRVGRDRMLHGPASRTGGQEHARLGTDAVCELGEVAGEPSLGPRRIRAPERRRDRAGGIGAEGAVALDLRRQQIGPRGAQLGDEGGLGGRGDGGLVERAVPGDLAPLDVARDLLGAEALDLVGECGDGELSLCRDGRREHRRAAQRDGGACAVEEPGEGGRRGEMDRRETVVRQDPADPIDFVRAVGVRVIAMRHGSSCVSRMSGRMSLRKR
jgi:hypothetical protein